MKKLITLLVGVIFALPAFSAIEGPRFCVDGIHYMIISDEEVTVISTINGNHPAWAQTLVGRLPDYVGYYASVDYSGDVVIPEKVSYNGVEYTVTEIALGAFTQCKDLKSVVMPNSIRALGEGAFYNCTSLEKVVLSKNIKVLWNQTFNGCKSLKSLDLSTFECVELLVGPSMDYVILPSDGINYIIHTKEDYRCKFIFPGEHIPYPMVAYATGLPEKSILYLTQPHIEGHNHLYALFGQTIYDPNAVENASISDVEVPKAEITINGNVVTAPQAYDVTIYDVAGATVAELRAGTSITLAVGAYIASSDGSSLKFIIK